MNWIEVKKDTHHLENHIWVECIASIKNNETGEIREYETDELLEITEDYPSVFSWQEGNNSCDCNRNLYFKRTNNKESEKDWNIECSEGKYSVNLRNKKDNMFYYSEFGIINKI